MRQIEGESEREGGRGRERGRARERDFYFAYNVLYNFIMIVTVIV